MKSFFKKILVWFLSLIIFFTTSTSSALAFSIGEEREVGEKLLFSVRSAFTLIDDPDITQYITKLGNSVLQVAGVQYFNYHFFVIDNKEFNAFAAPSGLIFFHSGLISAMQSEDELVSVLAHEIGHIVKRHLASRMEKGTYAGIASLGLAVAAIAFGGAAAPALVTGALATGQSINLHFSREHEEEADLLAYDWMKKLHRNPEGQASMLSTMRRIARYRSDKLPQYLLTHPNPEARLDYIESLIDIDRDKLYSNSSDDGDFDFFRFKYRVMSQVSENQQFKAYLASVISNPRASDFEKTMAKYGLAQVARNGNDYDRAIKLLDEVIHKYPDKIQLLVDKGVLQFESGEMVRAEQTLKLALQNNNSDMYATYTLAKLLYRTGRIPEAEQYFMTVKYEMPEYAKVYFDLGKIAAEKKHNTESAYYLAKYYLYEGKLQLAEHNLRQVLRDKNMPKELKEKAEELKKQIKKLRK